MILEGVRRGIELLVSLDPAVLGPVRVSLTVSSLATLLATLLGLPAALVLSAVRFPGRAAVEGLLRTLMGLPTVLLGLVLYALISRSGPLGSLGILYTQTAMVLGQTLLALPLVTGLALAALEQADPRIRPTLLGLGAGRIRASLAVAGACRAALLAGIAAGFGRVFSEVGVSMMLGGNIKGATRNITTGIAFETGRGEFAEGVALGLVLLTVALGVNLAAGLAVRRRRVP